MPRLQIYFHSVLCILTKGMSFMKKNLFVSLILIILVCSFTISVFAENTLDDLINQQNEIKTQKDTADSELEGVQNELSDTLKQIQELNTNISNYENEIQDLDKKTTELKTSIQDIENKLQIAQKNYDLQKSALEARLVAIYESGETTYLDVLLTSKSIADFISNYYLVSEITRYDTELLESIESEKNNIENSKKQLDLQKKEIEAIKLSKEKTSIAMQNAKSIKDNYMSRLTEEEKVIQEQIDTYEAQIKEIEAEIARITQGSINPDYIGGVMAWPVPGYTRITSTFGMRVHPITGVYKLHTGVDIGGAPIGTNFIAANDGVVVKAQYNAAYGNMVIIDHGGGISTLYAHGDEIVATLGQTVKKGDVILKVGSTGYSTGPHAHFEVRVNGTPVDPMPYITSQEKTEE